MFASCSCSRFGADNTQNCCNAYERNVNIRRRRFYRFQSKLGSYPACYPGSRSKSRPDNRLDTSLNRSRSVPGSVDLDASVRKDTPSLIGPQELGAEPFAGDRYTGHRERSLTPCRNRRDVDTTSLTLFAYCRLRLDLPLLDSRVSGSHPRHYHGFLSLCVTRIEDVMAGLHTFLEVLGS